MRDLADRIIDIYQRHAVAWDADRNRAGGWAERAWHERFAESLPPGASVLDLGCGPGMPVAAFLAERGAHVTGVDTSAAFIELCRKRLPAQEFLHADMRGLRLGRQFDGVLAWDSFFHLTPEDQRGMFDVFARHTAPQGVLMFNTGGAFGEVAGSYRGDPLYHASLDEAEYRTLLAQSGFNVTAHAVDDMRQRGGRTIWLARKQPEQLPG